MSRYMLIDIQHISEAPLYALVAARKDGALGPELRRSQADCTDAPPQGQGPPDPAMRCNYVAPTPGDLATGRARMALRGITMDGLARAAGAGRPARGHRPHGAQRLLRWRLRYLRRIRAATPAARCPRPTRSSITRFALQCLPRAARAQARTDAWASRGRRHRRDREADSKLGDHSRDISSEQTTSADAIATWIAFSASTPSSFSASAPSWSLMAPRPRSHRSRPRSTSGSPCTCHRLGADRCSPQARRLA